MSCCMMLGKQITAPNSCDDLPGSFSEVGHVRHPSKTSQIHLLIPDMHCAGCIQKIEKVLLADRNIQDARVNLSSKRVAVTWYTGRINKEDIIHQIEKLGFKVQLIDSDSNNETLKDRTGQGLLKCLAIAGFSSANIMLLSVSVWSGAEDVTRQLFHWISALIALPTVIYCGQPFYRSALRALRNYQMNMDVPISLAVLLAAAMSLFETFHKAEHTYFDASVMLLFFLLIGRYLDHMMREQAKSAISHLFSLQTNTACVIEKNGDYILHPLKDLKTGMTVFVASGERIPVDGIITSGTSDIDTSMVTGESALASAKEGQQVFSGTLNLTGPLEVEITALGEDTLLSEMIKCMEGAEANKSKYVKLSNKAAQIYAPAIHIIALACFIGWMIATNGDWHTSLLIAISVLIITCPCALGLAVPVVQIVASGVLFRKGIMLKDGTALEKLAQIDSVIFDKTGTLTLGQARFISAETDGGGQVNQQSFEIAAGLAIKSLHPLSKALVKYCNIKNISPAVVDDVQEIPGYGMQGVYKGQTVRLGRRDWEDGKISADNNNIANSEYLELCLKTENTSLVTFLFEDHLRQDAQNVIECFQDKSFDISILSGDRSKAVEQIAKQLGVTDWSGDLKPQDKVEYVNRVTQILGRKSLMVGDGINDAPALASGFASMAPSSASDIGRTAADFVFMGDSLAPVHFAHKVAVKSRILILENFTLAVIYNMIAVPIAFLGYASPLVAAIAMSSSSLIVTLNALRLQFNKTGGAS